MFVTFIPGGLKAETWSLVWRYVSQTKRLVMISFGLSRRPVLTILLGAQIYPHSRSNFLGSRAAGNAQVMIRDGVLATISCSWWRAMKELKKLEQM